MILVRSEGDTVAANYVFKNKKQAIEYVLRDENFKDWYSYANGFEGTELEYLKNLEVYGVIEFIPIQMWEAKNEI